MEAFPPPPPYWTLYAKGPEAGPPPPLPPASGAFSAFGVPHEADGDIPSLKELSRGQVLLLFPDVGLDQLDCKVWLRTLLQTLLQRYLALLDATLGGGDSTDGAGSLPLTNSLMEGLQHILLNLSHLLNMLRPRVAREDLLRIMEGQAIRREESALSVRGALEEVQQTLREAKQAVAEQSSAVAEMEGALRLR
eukprot:GGOE01036681.1.p1 GENE.GGOE01036681.1~~GGOE01036681.1.p1  ORF type:complete len:193 (+),score=44.99 GGOE01036681.1:51-629(+)